VKPARVPLPRLTREELGYRNAIAQAAGEVRFAAGGGEWVLQVDGLRESAPSAPAALRLEADWGGARFEVELPGDAGARLLRHLVPGAEAVELPESLQLAALEAMRGELEQALAAKGGASRRALRFNRLAPANGAASAPHGYAFTLTSAASGEAIIGRLWTDVSGLSYAAPLLRAAPRAAGAEAAWADTVAIPVRFEAGSTVLDRQELAGLEPGDLVLLDDCWLAGGEMTVAAGAGLAFRARLEERTLTVTQPLGPVMAEPANTPAAGDAAERVPVRLTFDLGERSMTVAELRELKPGYTFDLGRDLRRAVAIRAQGQLIGEGELVEIDGTLGVAITSLAPAAK